MKYKIIVSIALVLGIVLISLTNSDSTAQAQRNRTYFYDSGVVRLAPNQSLIGLLVPGLQEATQMETRVRSEKMQYAQVSCNGSLCEDMVVSTALDDYGPFPFAGRSLRDEVTQSPSSSAVRIVFSSNNPNLRANGQIVDVETGAVLSSYSFGCTGC